MHGDHDLAPAPGGLDGGELSAALARRPQWPEHGVRRAGDLVFGQPTLGTKTRDVKSAPSPPGAVMITIEGNYDFAVTADFDNVAGYLAYRDHPRHREIVANYIAPIRAEGAAVQYEF